MEEFLVIAIAFGLFVFVIGASALAVFTFLRVRTLDRRVRRLEQGAASVTPRAAPAAPAAVTETPAEPARAEQTAPPVESVGDEQTRDETTAPAQVTHRFPAPDTAPQKPLFDPLPERRPFDLEALIAGRWLNRIGILAVLLGTSFFLKFMFDNDWIGPSGRVAIGLVAGTALLAASEGFLRRGLRYFSEGVAALGAGVLFLSLYAAWDFYKLIPQGAAFGGMILVTAALAGLARGRDSQRLAALALLGGLATPGLLSTGVDSQTTLFVYLLALVAGFLALSWSKSWRSIAPIALAGVILYFYSWYDQFYTPAKLVPTACYAALFFALFAMLAALRSRRDKAPHLEEICTVVANALWFGVSLHLMLYDEHRWWLTLAVLALAGLYLALARAAATAAWRTLFAGLALAFATSAIPIRLEGEWIRTALAVEGAALVWAGFRSRVQALRGVGLALLAVVVALLLDASGDTERFILNERFLAFVAVVAGLGSSATWAAKHEGRLEPIESRFFALAGVAANTVAVWGLSEEAWRFLSGASTGLDPRLARQLGLSLLWTACGSLLIAVGVKKRSKALRWQGLVLIALVIAKVFLFDLSFLERGYRIISFVALGLVLLILSFFYQRGISGERKSGAS